MTKKDALCKINETKQLYLNDDQKIIARAIIEAAPDGENILHYYDFIMARTGLGFKFDISPEIAQGRIAVVNEMHELGINLYDLGNASDDENKLIIGDNFEALKNLLVTHKNKIDIIYIDPPYNTESARTDGNQSSKEGTASKFIYKDKFGRNGWLNMMKSRLELAKDLLADEGVIFVSIDDSEQAYLKVLMDGIFGEENFVTSFVWERTYHSNKNNSGKKIFRNADYIITYAKNSGKIHFFNEGVQKDFNNAPLLNKTNREQILMFQKGKVWLKMENKFNEKDIFVKFNSRWSQNKINSEILLGTTFIIKGKNNKAIRAIYSDNKSGYKLPNQILNTSKKFINKYMSVTTENGTAMLSKILGKENFPYPKPVGLIQYLIELTQKKDSFILDFFAGSGTTGHAVMELNREDGGNRKFILCTNNENNIAIDITYERIYRIIKGQGTNGQNFKWLETNKPFINSKLRVFNIKHYNVATNNSKELNQIKNEAWNNLELLNPDYKPREETLDIYYDLNGLNPYSKVQKQQKYSTDPLKEDELDYYESN